MLACSPSKAVNLHLAALTELNDVRQHLIKRLSVVRRRPIRADKRPCMAPPALKWLRAGGFMSSSISLALLYDKFLVLCVADT